MTTPPTRLPLASRARPRSFGLPGACLLAVTLAALVPLSGCVPVVLGGAMVGGALAATDRRTAGTQIEDQSIEFKAANRVREQLGGRGNVSAVSYNRTILLLSLIHI